MKIFVGADHRGFALKKAISTRLQGLGYEIVDLGSHQKGVSCDYPKISFKVATAVARHPDARGILVCMSGIGHTIAANKVRGAYAALCYNKTAARLARAHNNSNILVLGAKFVARKEMDKIVLTWLKTGFDGGRHARRVGQIKKIERMFCVKRQGTTLRVATCPWHDHGQVLHQTTPPRRGGI